MLARYTAFAHRKAKVTKFRSLLCRYRGMDFFDKRRQALVRAVRERDWVVSVDSADGEAMRDLEMLGWVELETVGPNYRHMLTERGLERHASWGDERRLAFRPNTDETDLSEAS